jgi:hypothetical protein
VRLSLLKNLEQCCVSKREVTNKHSNLKFE